MQAMQKDLEIAQAKATLMQAGISPDYVDDAVTIAMARVAVDKDLDIEGVAKDLKSKYSVWFEGSSKDEGTTSGASSSEKKTTGQKGTGRNPGTSDSSNSSNNNGISGIGKRLAIAKKSSMPEKSFWND